MSIPLPTSYTQVSAPRRKASFSIPKLSIHDNRRRTSSFVNGSNSLIGKDFLLSRGRITNLGILLLVFTGLISLLINFRLYFNNIFRDHYKSTSFSTYSSIKSTISLQPSSSLLENLIIIPCHGIYLGPSNQEEELENSSNWLTNSNKPGNFKTLIKHIKKGINLNKRDKKSLLIFTGGQTKLQSILTESISYFNYASSHKLFDTTSSSSPTTTQEDDDDSIELNRVTTENYALDSYQNILFSIIRFKEFTGHYPLHITIVGFEFKRTRFETIHRKALKISNSKFIYIGIDNDNESDELEGEEVNSNVDDIEGERVNGLEPYTKDSYGCHTELMNKRRNRNPYRRYHPYHSSAPELIGLLEYCPVSNHIYPGKLPWH